MESILLEKIDFEKGKSFKVFSPRLRNTYLWHYHPEFELVYVEADAGIRHVGTHVSTYTNSDLVFIGSNLPHLNFDYRLRSDYQQTVIQLKTDFLGNALSNTPEFTYINELFTQAAFGIAFGDNTKAIVANKLKQLTTLPPLEQLLELMKVFHTLAIAKDKELLNRDSRWNKFMIKDKIRMGAIYQYIDAEYHNKPDVKLIAEKVNLTTSAFCRYFKKQTNMTFTEFVNQYRIERAKNLLMQNKNVSEVCFAVGLESLSYFNKIFRDIVGENPSDFRRKWNQS
jgi:AraC-like DNA-binding protein